MTLHRNSFPKHSGLCWQLWLDLPGLHPSYAHDWSVTDENRLENNHHTTSGTHKKSEPSAQTSSRHQSSTVPYFSAAQTVSQAERHCRIPSTSQSLPRLKTWPHEPSSNWYQCADPQYRSFTIQNVSRRIQHAYSKDHEIRIQCQRTTGIYSKSLLCWTHKP